MKISASIFMIIISLTLSAQNFDKFDSSVDVGNPKISGQTTFDDISQSYTLTGSGYNIWFARDEFHFAQKKISGDFIVTANFQFIGDGVDPHRKTGWMIRPSLEESSKHISATLHGDGLTQLQWRENDGAEMRDPEDQINAPKSMYEILQLERIGNMIIMRAAMPGEPLQEIGRKEFELPEEVHAGLFICSHNPDVKEQSKVWNVRIDKPVADDYNPYSSGWLGSRLELLDVFSGERKVIHTDSSRFEAPNWMPDGQHILFNQDGSLYTLPITGGKKVKLNTGFADRNNNDHGISFDGKMLAISHDAGEGSTVYVLPLKGGTPRQVTDKTPSYWHGWSADGKDVVYVARRDHENYDIYKKSIDGGEEIRLTDYAGAHADGCEYSPDGKYIYYNASPTGTMQLWRMKPDGSDKEQVTFDQYNDWFPHISPDGKWILFISFPTHIDPNSHPSFKRVMLRLMPAAGGPPKVVAYLYGGQGTINVPSWSPDSRSVAFVTNTRQ